MIEGRGPGVSSQRFADLVDLMERLRQFPRNAEAWERFVELYRPKIYGWCRVWGLQEADAEDVAQDVIAKLTQKMMHFDYDRTRCFRAWLKTITQHALSDLLASRCRALGDGPAPILSSIEARTDLEKRIEELFDRELLDLAIARVRERVAPVTWDAFRLTTFDEYSGARNVEVTGNPRGFRLRGQTPGSEDSQRGTRQAG